MTKLQPAIQQLTFLAHSVQHEVIITKAAYRVYSTIEAAARLSYYVKFARRSLSTLAEFHSATAVILIRMLYFDAAGGAGVIEPTADGCPPSTKCFINMAVAISANNDTTNRTFLSTLTVMTVKSAHSFHAWMLSYWTRNLQYITFDPVYDPTSIKIVLTLRGLLECPPMTGAVIAGRAAHFRQCHIVDLFNLTGSPVYACAGYTIRDVMTGYCIPTLRQLSRVA